MEDVFIHPNALVESDEIGRGTRVWAFAHVLKGARIGADCNLCDHSFVENGATLGDRVTVKNGVSIWEGVSVGDDVFLGPNAVLTNDLNPRSKGDFKLATTRIERGATVGANATIICGVTLGEYCMIGAGAVLTRDAPAYTLMLGVPARPAGWVCRCGQRMGDGDGRPLCEACDAQYEVDGEGLCRPEKAAATDS